MHCLKRVHKHAINKILNIVCPNFIQTFVIFQKKLIASIISYYNTSQCIPDCLLKFKTGPLIIFISHNTVKTFKFTSTTSQDLSKNEWYGNAINQTLPILLEYINIPPSPLEQGYNKSQFKYKTKRKYLGSLGHKFLGVRHTH